MKNNKFLIFITLAISAILATTLLTTPASAEDPLPNPELPGSCGIDMVLILDSSGSIGGYMQTMKDAFNLFVDAFLPKTPTRMAVVDFDSSASLLLSYSNNVTQIKNAINQPTASGGTRYVPALQTAYNEFVANSRADKPDLFIFASDGYPGDSYSSIIAQANTIKQAGVKIITLGIGSSVSTYILESMASPEDFYQTSFQTLATDLANLSQELCGGTISVQKFVDGTPESGWNFSTTVENGTIEPTWGITDDTGFVVFNVNVSECEECAKVTITEESKSGYSFEDVYAENCTQHEVGTPGEGTIYDIPVFKKCAVYCRFNNSNITGEDSIPPITNKTVGEPKYGENDEWVTLDTEFNLTAEDNPEGSGVKETYFRIWWNNSGTWDDITGVIIYTDNFTIGDYHSIECHHLIEYWSVDNAGNTECHHYQDHYVDESCPEPDPYPPEFGNPKTTTDYNDSGNITTYTLISCNTPMWINVSDPGCGVGAYKLHYDVWYNTQPKQYKKIQGSDVTIYDGEVGDLDNTKNGKISAELTFNEGCFHEVRWDVEDYFGHICYYDYDFAVDCTPPDLTKYVGEPEIPATGEYTSWVSPQTPFIFNATDLGCNEGAGVWQIGYEIRIKNYTVPGKWDLVKDATIFDNQTGDEWDTYGIIQNITYLDESCAHEISFWAIDYLGNRVDYKQKHKVDITPPKVIKTIGDPNCSDCPNCEEGDYCVTTETVIHIEAYDLGCEGGVGLETLRYRIWDENGWKQWNYDCLHDGETFTFEEECKHYLEIEAWDRLHNLYTDNETFYVDDKPPMIVKTIGDPNITGIGGKPDYWINCTTTITIDAYDEGCCDNLTYVGYSINKAPLVEIPLNDLPKTIMLPSCVHTLDIKAMDCLGNTRWDNETFYVDCDEPDIKKIVGEPNCTTCPNCQQGDFCVKTSTPITISAKDKGCMGGVGLDYVKYRIWNGTSWTNWLYRPLTFTFKEECKHYLEIEAADLLGNIAFDNETFFVDDKPPKIIKKVGEPNITGGLDGPDYWVSCQTPIIIDAYDEGCCNELEYVGYSINKTPLKEIKISDLPKTIHMPEDCIHTLDIKAMDCLGNTKWDNETFYVDCTPPDSSKVIEGTHYPASQADIDTFGLTGEEIEYFWLRDNDTLVIISARDNETHRPCVIGLDYIHIEVWLDTDFDNVTDTLVWEHDNYTSQCSFKIMQDCLHEIIWYGVDKLGNQEIAHHQFHRVDSTPPNSTKEFIGSTWPADDYPNPAYGPDKGMHYWVTSDTMIRLTGVDEMWPCAVGIKEFNVTIKWDSDCDGIVDTTLFSEMIPDPYVFEFNFSDFKPHPGAPWQAPYEGLHEISWYAIDHLENIEILKVQYHWVDDTPPHVIIHKPVDGWYKDGGDIPASIKAVDKTNPHGPCNSGGAVGIADGKTGGGYLIDVFPSFKVVPLDGTHLIYNENTQKFVGKLIIPDPSGLPDGSVLFVANVSDNLGNDGNSMIEILHAIFMQVGDDENLFKQLILQYLMDRNIVYVGIDNTAPIVDITKPDPGQTIGPDSVYISANMMDGLSGITSGAICYITLNDVYIGALPYINGGCSGTIMIPSNMPSGNYLPLTVSVYDNAGNEGKDTVLVNLTNNPQNLPFCRIKSPSNDTTHKDTIPVVIEAYDPETTAGNLIVGIEVERQGDPPFIFAASHQSGNDFVYNLDITKYQDGAKIKIKAYATDEDGNTVYSDPRIYWVDSDIAFDKWLNKGWNILTLPLDAITCNFDLEKVFASIYDHINIVFYYNSTGDDWDSWVKGRDNLFNDLVTIEPGKTYFINVTKKGGVRYYSDTKPPNVMIDEPDDGLIYEAVDYISVIANDGITWIDNVWISIYDFDNNTYWDGSGWHACEYWIECCHYMNDEWRNDTNGVTWGNNHNYTITAKAYDAVGCMNSDAVDFTIHWPVYNISGTVYYECGETGTIHVMLFDELIVEGLTPIDYASMDAPGVYTFHEVSNGTYYIAAMMDANGNSNFEYGDEPLGLAINKSMYAGEPADPIDVIGGDKNGVDITLFTMIDVEIISPDFGVIAGDEPLTINGTAYSPCSCIEAENVSIAIYYTNYSDDPDKTYYWNDNSGAWEWTTIIYNSIDYLGGGCGTPLEWEFSPNTEFFHEGAYIHYIHVKAKDKDGNTGEKLGYFTVGIPESDFLSYWQLDGNLIDTIGGNHGTGYGNIAPTTGQVNQGYSFDGDGDYIMVNPSISTKSDWTWSGWIWPDDDAGVTMTYYSEGDYIKFSLVIQTDGKLGVGMWNSGYSGNWINVYTSSGAINFDQWNHVTISLSGGGVGTGTLKIYIDGQEITDTTGQITSACPQAVLGYNIGVINHQFPFQTQFVGAMDEVAIFNRALSSDEVQQCYDNGYYGYIGYLG